MEAADYTPATARMRVNICSRKEEVFCKPAAVKKLGLDLEKKRENAEMLIVDHCEQLPTEN